MGKACLGKKEKEVRVDTGAPVVMLNLVLSLTQYWFSISVRR